MLKNQGIVEMDTINHVIKWSLVTSSLTGVAIATGIFSIWLAIEILVTLTKGAF